MPGCRLAADWIRRSSQSLSSDRRGEVALEYGLIVAMIAIALLSIMSMSGVAEHQSDMFNLLSDSMSP